MSEQVDFERIKFKVITEPEVVSGCSGAAIGATAGLVYIAMHDFPTPEIHTAQTTVHPHLRPKHSNKSDLPNSIEVLAPATALAIGFTALTSAARYALHRHKARRYKNYINSGLRQLLDYSPSADQSSK